MTSVKLPTVVFAWLTSIGPVFAGDLLIAESGPRDILSLSLDGSSHSVFATRMGVAINGVDLDKSGRVYGTCQGDGNSNASYVDVLSSTGTHLFTFGANNYTQQVTVRDSDVLAACFMGHVDQYVWNSSHTGMVNSGIWANLNAAGPHGIAQDSNGTVYVSISSHFLPRWNASGNPLSAFTMPAAGRQVTADTLGGIYVALSNSTAIKMDQSGNVLATYVTGDNTLGVTVDSDGFVYASSPTSVYKFKNDGTSLGVIYSGLSAGRYLNFRGSAVPEPASISMGWLALVAMRKRREHSEK